MSFGTLARTAIRHARGPILLGALGVPRPEAPAGRHECTRASAVRWRSCRPWQTWDLAGNVRPVAQLGLTGVQGALYMAAWPIYGLYLHMDAWQGPGQLATGSQTPHLYPTLPLYVPIYLQPCTLAAWLSCWAVRGARFDIIDSSTDALRSEPR